MNPTGTNEAAYGIFGWFAAGEPTGDRSAWIAQMAGRSVAPSAFRNGAVCHLDSSIPATSSLSAAGESVLLGAAVRPQGGAWEGRLFSEPNRACAEVHGDFALAAFDHAGGRALLAVDRSGARSLYYAVADGVLVFASSLQQLIRHPAVRSEIEPQALYDYIHFHVIPGPGTIYRDIRRLLPGEYALFERGSLRLGSYWSPIFSESEATDFNRLRDEFRALLSDAVRRASAGHTTACFLSGGTDSSTMLGMLGQTSGARPPGFSIGFAATGYDEIAFARIAAQRFNADHHEYYVTPDDVAAAIPQIAAAYAEPFGNSSAIPTYYCARFAKQHGIQRMIAGDGGDELFGGNERYAKQYVFNLYESIPSPLRQGLIEPLVQLPGFDALPIARKAKSYVAQAKVPMPDRLESYNLLERIGAEQVFDPEFLASIDRGRPLALRRAIYHGSNARSQINRMLALDFRVTLADNDLPKVTRMCALAEVEVAFPMLDDALFEFSLRLAPQLKLRGRKLRYFFKEALRGFLPDEIINKQKHGFGLPFGVWMLQHPRLLELSRDSLSSLKGRAIIRPAFIDDLLGDKTRQHPGYYGTMVWVLMMLELWFQAHRS
jgi:asparagine synthase (glutamine-hydrolysing)